MTRLALAAALAVSFAARAQAPKTDDDKTLYAIGYITGGRVTFLQLKPNELKVVEQGFHDAATGAKAKAEPEERQEAINKLVQARTNAAADKEKAASKDFIAKAAQEKGAQKTPSGLIFKVVRPGNG